MTFFGLRLKYFSLVPAITVMFVAATAFAIVYRSGAESGTVKQQLPLTGANVVSALQSADCKYNEILKTGDIPLPASAPAGAAVNAIYSPAVFKLGRQYVMLFGVSVYCQNNTVARDSIAYATSQDGLTFTFRKYVLEPDPSVCSIQPSNWVQGVTYQVNDPAVVLDKRPDGIYLIVVYTSVAKDKPIMECGNIGIAVFKNDFAQSPIFRNDFYLPPGTSSCILGQQTGFSRPNIVKLAQGSNDIWFDSTGNSTARVHLSNFNQLSAFDVEPVDTPGLDIEVFNAGPDTVLLSQYGGGGGGLAARWSPRSAWSWSQWTLITQLSGQQWDRTSHGSPHLFTQTQPCLSMLYFAGADFEKEDYKSASIAVAAPRSSTTQQMLCQIDKN